MPNEPLQFQQIPEWSTKYPRLHRTKKLTRRFMKKEIKRNLFITLLLGIVGGLWTRSAETTAITSILVGVGIVLVSYGVLWLTKFAHFYFRFPHQELKRLQRKQELDERRRAALATTESQKELSVVTLKLRSFHLEMLPINVDWELVPIILLHPNRKGTFYTIHNPLRKPCRYPTTKVLPDIKGKKVPTEPPTMISRCELTSYGDKTLLSIVLQFKITFYEGSSSETPIISTLNYEVTVPDLKPNELFRFFVVNQAPYMASVEFPRIASLQVVGESVRRTVELASPVGIDDFIQSLPHWSYVATNINWDE